MQTLEPSTSSIVQVKLSIVVVFLSLGPVWHWLKDIPVHSSELEECFYFLLKGKGCLWNQSNFICGFILLKYREASWQLGNFSIYLRRLLGIIYWNFYALFAVNMPTLTDPHCADPLKNTGGALSTVPQSGDEGFTVWTQKESCTWVFTAPSMV